MTKSPGFLGRSTNWSPMTPRSPPRHSDRFQVHESKIYSFPARPPHPSPDQLAAPSLSAAPFPGGFGDQLVVSSVNNGPRRSKTVQTGPNTVGPRATEFRPPLSAVNVTNWSCPPARETEIRQPTRPPQAQTTAFFASRIGRNVRKWGVFEKPDVSGLHSRDRNN